MTDTGMSRGALAGRWIASLEARPLGHVWLGLAVFAALLASLILYWVVFDLWGRMLDPTLPLGLAPYARVQVTLCALLAWLVAAPRWVEQRAAQDFAPLLPMARASPDEIERLSERANTLPIPGLALCIAIGFSTGFSMIFLTTDQAARVVEDHGWDRFAWPLAANTAIFTLIARSIWTNFRTLHVLERIAPAADRVSLLDLSPLAPFARLGLRTAAVWIGGSSIASLLVLGLDRIAALLVVLVVTLTLGGVAFVLPARAVHRRIRAQKSAELHRIRSEVTRARESALRGGAEHASLLPGLLAYESRIASVPEWPFDLPTLLRLGALAVVATGSWLGGAMVERLLGVVLD